MTPDNFKTTETRDAFAALDLDLAVVVAYGLILPKAVLDAPRLGCVNLHASLLPRWRGAAPIQRAIIAGDRQTGITAMQMAAGLDSGSMLVRREVGIAPDETGGSLHDRLAALGGDMVGDVVDGLAAGRLTAMPQPQAGVVYANKIDKREARIIWRRPAVEVDRVIRALSPFPGAWFPYEDGRVKVLMSAAVAGAGEPGTVLDDQLTIACDSGAVRLLRVQPAGKKPMTAQEFLRGRALEPGMVLA